HRARPGVAGERAVHGETVARQRVHPLVRFLSLFLLRPLPAHMTRDLRVRQVDRPSARQQISPRSEQPERRRQGTEAGTPGKAVRRTGRTWSYGWEGQLAVR